MSDSAVDGKGTSVTAATSSTFHLVGG